MQQQQQLQQLHQQQEQQEPKSIVANKGSQFIFPEEMQDTLYPSLKPGELEKIIKCRFCQRQFTFLSEHLVHLEMHTNIVLPKGCFRSHRALGASVFVGPINKKAL